MKKNNNPREVKTIYRFGIPVILTGIFSLISLILGISVLILPLLTASFEVDGNPLTYSINGLDIISSCTQAFGFTLLPASESLKGFTQVLSADMSAVTNPIILMFKDYFAFGVLALGVVLIIPMIGSLFQIFNVIKFLIFGKAHNFKSPKRIAKFQFNTLLITIFIFLIFQLLFQDLLKVVYGNTSKVEHIITLYMLLLAVFINWMILSVLYNFTLKDRVYVPRYKKYQHTTVLKTEESKPASIKPVPTEVQQITKADHNTEA